MTPYFLTYGMEAVQPAEIETRSLRIVLEAQVPENEWLQERYDSLMLLDEQRANALSTVRMNKARIERSFNGRVKPRHIKVGDMVLQSYRAPLPVDPRGKFKPPWAGPYKVKEILPGGAARLMDDADNEFKSPVNLDQLKKYYP